MASNGNAQRGGFGVGVVVGLLVGLVLALAVALYVTKAPIPFMDKVPQRTAEQDAAEVEKNRNWDPNAPLHGKNPAKPSQAPVPARADSPAAAQDAVASAVANAAAGAAAAASAPARAASAVAARASAAASASAKPGTDAFVYFVQVGAYASSDDAEQSKPAPDIVQAALKKAGLRPEEAIMLGDTPYDLEAAARAGVRSVALESGGWGIADLTNAQAVYKDAADLLARFDHSPFARAESPSAAAH